MKSRLCDNDPHVLLAVCNNNGAVPLQRSGGRKQLQASEGNGCTKNFKDFSERTYLSGDSHGDSAQHHQRVEDTILAASETTLPKQD